MTRLFLYMILTIDSLSDNSIFILSPITMIRKSVEHTCVFLCFPEINCIHGTPVLSSSHFFKTTLSFIAEHFSVDIVLVID